jgi:uncharacterized protein YcnI
VGPVRRALAVFALSAVFLVLLAGPAAAHPGILDPYVPIHVLTSVALGVPSELPSPMVEIDVTLPFDFALQAVAPVPGWQESSSPGQLRFFDGNVPQGGYAEFNFSGVFAQKRVIELPVITRAADGTAVDWDQPPTGALPAAVLFPGYAVGAVPIAGVVLPPSTTSHGHSRDLVAGIVVALVGAVGAVLFATRRRRKSARNTDATAWAD